MLFLKQKASVLLNVVFHTSNWPDMPLPIKLGTHVPNWQAVLQHLQNYICTHTPLGSTGSCHKQGECASWKTRPRGILPQLYRDSESWD